jgi:hypothetical protein
MYNKMGGKKSRKHLGGKRHKKGGQSANQYMMETVGNGDTQWNNVFKGNGNSDNAIVGLQGQSASSAMNPAAIIPNSLMQGGKKHRTKKGGNFGSLISRAIVPLSLWAMQNKYSKKKGLNSFVPSMGMSKTRKHRKSNKSKKSRKYRK